MYNYGNNSGKSDLKTTLNSNKIGSNNIGKKPLTTLTTNKYSKSDLEEAKNSLKGLKGIGGINVNNNNNLVDNNYRKQFKPDFSNTLNSKQSTLKKEDPDINIYVNNNKDISNSKLNFAKKYGGGSSNLGGYSNSNNQNSGTLSSQSNRMGSYTNSKLNKQTNDNKFSNEMNNYNNNDINYSNKISNNSKINTNSKYNKKTEEFDNPVDNMIAQNTKR